MIRILTYFRPTIFLLVVLSSLMALMYGAWADSPIFGEPASLDFFTFPFQYRLGAIFVTITLFLTVYFGTKQHAGRNWALVAFFLAAFSPTLLAAGHYFTTSIIGVLLGTLAILVFLNLFEKKSRYHLILPSIVLALALLISATNAFLIVSFSIIVLVAALRVFSETRHQGGSRLGAFRRAGAILNNFGIILIITGLLIGLAFLVFGKYFTNYWSNFLALLSAWPSNLRSFSPLRELATDEPLPNVALVLFITLFVFGTATRAFVKRVLRRGESLSGIVALYFPEISLAILILVAIFLNIPRVFLLPILFIFMTLVLKNWFTIPWFRSAKNLQAKLTVIYRERFRIGARSLVLLAIFAWWVFAAVNTFPHSLPEDRGQDLYRLQSWVDRQAISQIAVDYYGPLDPTRLLRDRAIPWWSALGSPISDEIEWLAVSRRKLTPASRNREDSYEWLNNKLQPSLILGTTISVYYLGE